MLRKIKILNALVIAAIIVSGIASCSKKTIVGSTFKEKMYEEQDFMNSRGSAELSVSNEVLSTKLSAPISDASRKVENVKESASVIIGENEVVKSDVNSTVAKKAPNKIVAKLEKAKSKKGSGKSQIIALILVLFVGGIGIHRFYLGYIWQGVVQLLTFGGCGIWSFIDLIRIITGDLRPKNGDYDQTF